jgi:hypothetical protein
MPMTVRRFPEGRKTSPVMIELLIMYACKEGVGVCVFARPSRPTDHVGEGVGRDGDDGADVGLEGVHLEVHRAVAFGQSRQTPARPRPRPPCDRTQVSSEYRIWEEWRMPSMVVGLGWRTFEQIRPPHFPGLRECRLHSGG